MFVDMTIYLSLSLRTIPVQEFQQYKAREEDSVCCLAVHSHFSCKKPALLLLRYCLRCGFLLLLGQHPPNRETNVIWYFLHSRFRPIRQKRGSGKRENERSLQDMPIQGRKANEGGNRELMLDMQQQNQY